MFNVGDRVRRVRDGSNRMPLDSIWKVTAVTDNGLALNLEDMGNGWNAEYFALEPPEVQENSVVRYVSIYFTARNPERIKTEFSHDLNEHGGFVRFLQENPADYTLLAQKKLTLKY